ncbi:NAD(P)H-binding protein [Gilvimarinus sp. F26214L]
MAIRLADQLGDDYACHGLRRHTDKLPPTIRPIAWDLDQHEGLAERIGGFDVVVITLVPGSRDEAGYRRTYVENLRAILAALEASPRKPRQVIFVSSTSVYGQSQGEWIDEGSTTEPVNFRGKLILAGEEILRRSTLPHCVVRFSGIYGPGRERLLGQVAQGKRSPRANEFSNRIHSEDCAGFLAHIIRRTLAGQDTAATYLASDCEPVPLAVVEDWLAERMQVQLPAVTAQSAGGKRCRNHALLESGYEFRYPTFREGYKDMLENSGITGRS